MVRSAIYKAFAKGEALKCSSCGDKIFTDGTSLFSHGYEIARKIGLATVLRTGFFPPKAKEYQRFPGHAEANLALQETPQTQHHMNL